MKPILQPLIDQFGLIPGWALLAVFMFLRYAVVAGGVYLIFYSWLKGRFQPWKIQPKAPQTQQLLNEIKHSAYTALIFAGVATGVFIARQFGYTKHYFEISEHGVAYLIFSMFMLVFLHDTYFYWMHRLMHAPRLFRLVHRVHHESFNPTPMTSLSFHPVEALLEFGIVPLVVFVLPIHPLALLFLSLWSMTWNLVGHLGYELFPASFARHWFWGYVNTSTHHNMHHQRVTCNYGLYFNFWDRWMHTNHPKYVETFEAIRTPTVVQAK